jgi:Immunoglobulin-like domain of bacterial spore germination
VSYWLSIPLTILALLGLGTAISFILPKHDAQSQTDVQTSIASTTTIPPLMISSGSPIVVFIPSSGEMVSSPLHISGEARRNWFFEASAPVELRDTSGTVLAHGSAQAQGDWMTSNYVPFVATLTFTTPTSTTGLLVLKNDNASGELANQKELDIPLRFH